MFYLIRAEPVIPDSIQDFNRCNELDRGSNRSPVMLKKKMDQAAPGSSSQPELRKRGP